MRDRMHVGVALATGSPDCAEWGETALHRAASSQSAFQSAAGSTRQPVSTFGAENRTIFNRNWRGTLRGPSKVSTWKTCMSRAYLPAPALASVVRGALLAFQ